MKILRSQKMNQKVVTGLTGKKYNTVADEVIGKYAVVIEVNGFISAGVGETEELAIENAKTNIKSTQKETNVVDKNTLYLAIETYADLTSRTIDSVKADILNNNKVVMENITTLTVATIEDAVLTASIISFNCFDQIKRFYNFGTMATHQWIKDFAVEFENTHKNVKSWEEFLEDKSSSDWEEYLIDCVNQKLV